MRSKEGEVRRYTKTGRWMHKRQAASLSFMQHEAAMPTASVRW